MFKQKQVFIINHSTITSCMHSKLYYHNITSFCLFNKIKTSNFRVNHNLLSTVLTADITIPTLQTLKLLSIKYTTAFVAWPSNSYNPVVFLISISSCSREISAICDVAMETVHFNLSSLYMLQFSKMHPLGSKANLFYAFSFQRRHI